MLRTFPLTDQMKQGWQVSVVTLQLCDILVVPTAPFLDSKSKDKPQMTTWCNRKATKAFQTVGTFWVEIDKENFQSDIFIQRVFPQLAKAFVAGAIEMKEMSEIVETLFEMEGVSNVCIKI